MLNQTAKANGIPLLMLNVAAANFGRTPTSGDDETKPFFNMESDLRCT